MRVAEKIALHVDALRRCEMQGKKDMVQHWKEQIDRIVERYLPRGCGFDAGTQLSVEDSQPERLVFYTSYHHMDGYGYYTCWTHHRVVVRPSFVYGVDVQVSGPNRGDIKDYIANLFTECLLAEAEEPPLPVASSHNKNGGETCRM